MMNKIAEFVNKFPKNCRLAIWGSGYTGIMIKEYLEKHRPDINIVLWVDTFKTDKIDGVEVISPIQLKENLSKIDLLFLSTTKYQHKHEIILKFINCPFVVISEELELYCRKVQTYPEMLEAAEIFTFEEDKAVYNMVCNYYLNKNLYPIQHYVKDKFGLSLARPFDNERQYLDFINKDAIKIMVDAGMSSGLECLMFKKHFKNIKKIYGFEPIYEKTKDEILDFYITKDIPELKILPYGLWNKKDTVMFNLAHVRACANINGTNKRGEEIIIKTISLKDFKEEYNVDKIDYIKFDIEGAELEVLKSSEEIILKDRPQMAISIYHQDGQDLIDIPLYLKTFLKDQNYIIRLDHYSTTRCETLLYAIPKELYMES